MSRPHKARRSATEGRVGGSGYWRHRRDVEAFSLYPRGETKLRPYQFVIADITEQAEGRIALRHCFVPILTNSKQINPLRSFPSEIKVPEVFEKSKNYPESSVSKFSHYSSSIILLELLLEVVPVSSKFLRVTDIIPVPKGAVPDNRIVLVQRRTRKPRFLDANQPSLRARQ